jgi:hypothetical protein
MHYRDQWYVECNPAPVMFGFGVCGQYLFVAPEQEVVIAKVSSQANGARHLADYTHEPRRRCPTVARSLV